MPSHTIVAVYDTHAHADLAIADLSVAGIPDACIKHYTDETKSAIATTETPAADNGRSQGFWAWLMGEDEAPDDHVLYDRSIESGQTVVTVIADDANVEQISRILEEHAPVDVERTAGSIAPGSVIASRLKRYTVAHPVDEQVRLRDLAFANRR